MPPKLSPRPLWHDRIALMLFGIVLVVSGLAHGFNMFHFPYFENDEGVYMSQAWSVVTQGELAPYTYWYDHAPAGWILIAFWTLLTGGFYTFGFSLNSGRVLMLVLHVISTLLVMMITRKLTRNNFAAVFAGLLYSLTPIGLYFHRRILLDNIMIFWVLFSYYFLIRDKMKLYDVLISALMFGVAVLSKENAVFFIPGFLATMVVLSHQYHRNLVILKWLMVSSLVVSTYFLYALLKGELFPSGTWLGGDHDHVSLLETLRYQSSREGGSITDLQGSLFWRSFFQWMRQDVVITVLSVVSTVLVTAFSLFKSRRQYLGVAFLNLFFWFFLLRGGVVFEFYVVPLLAFTSILSGIVFYEIWHLFERFVSPVMLYAGTVVLLIYGSFGYFIYGQESRSFSKNEIPQSFYTSRQTASQLQAVDFIRQRFDHDDIMLIDNYAYIDLQDPANPSGVHFRDAEWYWKVDLDREIGEELLNNDPEKVDLIAITPQMAKDLASGVSPLTTEIMENARMWKIFDQDDWDVQLWRPLFPSHILERAWESYRQEFIIDGRVYDPELEITTSEGQSYALLQAVWNDDQATFDQVLEWTNQELRLENNLFAWKYGAIDQPVEAQGVLDRQAATDADQDIALALLFAYRRWGNQAYFDQASELIDAIWEYEVKEMNGQPYILAGPWAQGQTGIVTNPSYLSPYIYRIFQEVDPDHDWSAVVDSSYQVLEACSAADFGERDRVFLPPEWCQILPSGRVQIPNIEGIDDVNYGYNAIRVPWRVAVDYHWYQEDRALAYLEQLDFFADEWRENERIAATYYSDGEVADDYESVASYANNLAYFSVMQPELASEIYDSKIKGKFFEDDRRSFWDDPDNYYNQNWGWFGTALYADLLPNLWEE